MFVTGLKARSPQQIAVVEMDGAIGQKIKPGEYVKLLHQLEQNDHVKAVVLDVDSPGGSATGSNYLYLAVESLSKKKPVVTFFRGLGASGAYMLAAPSQRIISIPSAIIGSIGVISLHPLVYEALDRIGVKMTATKSDRLKDMGSAFREPTEEEKRKEQELVDDLYNQFLDIVAAGRKMDIAKVREVATGEVYTGRKAVEVGLVDELGDLEHAIDVAAELSGAQRNPVWLRPKKNLREVLSSAMGTSSIAASMVDAVINRIEERLLTRYDFQHRL